MLYKLLCCTVFLFISIAPSGIYTLSLHDALPIFVLARQGDAVAGERHRRLQRERRRLRARPHDEVAAMFEGLSGEDRKSTRLNSSHPSISYAVFCLKKKKFTFIISTIHFTSLSLY